MYIPEDTPTLQELLRVIGSKEECLRLGFIVKNDNENLFISAVGLGYLLYLSDRKGESPAEAYASGFEAGNHNSF